MVRVTVWLQLLLVVLILRQSAAVSDQCSKLQDEISRLERDFVNITELKHNNYLRAGNCHEHLTKQDYITKNTSMELNKIEEENSRLNKQLDEFRKIIEQSDSANKVLKTQLEAKEEDLKYSNQKQKQLHITIDGLTKTVKSLNQTVQRLIDTPEHVCRSLLAIAKSGDVNSTKILFKCNDTCTDHDTYRNTPLTYAVLFGHVEVVRLLLEGGANVERANADRSTALHIAAFNGRLDVCRLLLDWGANVDRLNRWQNTPLHWAAGEGHLSVVKLLVERGADVSVKDEDGQTASYLARSRGKKNVADWLDSVTRG